MATPSPKGGLDLTPVVSIGGVDMGECAEKGPCELEIVAYDVSNGTATMAGTVAFKMKSSGGMAYRSGKSSSFETVVGRYGDGTSLDRAGALLEMTAGYSNTYTPVNRSWVAGGDGATGTYPVDFDIVLGGNGNGWRNKVFNVSQSRVYAMGPSKLLIPTGTPAPAKWMATLPVTIYVK